VLQSYLLPPSTHNMTSTPVIWQYVSKLLAQTGVVKLCLDCARLRRHNILTLIKAEVLLSVTALQMSIDCPYVSTCDQVLFPSD